MYEFTRGPLVWIAFLVFVFGSGYRLFATIKLARDEKVILPYMSLKFGARSILHWVVPFGSRNMRIRPVFTVLSYLFHFCLIITPIFVLGHNILWKQSWGISWWTLPESMSNAMTIIVVAIGIVFVLRRIADPTVRLVTSYKDYLLLALVLAPFITGLLAYYQIFHHKTVVILHMWSGAVWLMSIPFTRISHMLFFALTRAYMGSEFGFVRNAKDW